MYNYVVKTIGVEDNISAMFFNTKKEARTAYDSMFAALIPSMTDFVKSIDYSDNADTGVCDLEIDYKDCSKSSVRLIKTSDYIYEAVSDKIDEFYENNVSRCVIEGNEQKYIDEILCKMRDEIIAKDIVMDKSFINEVEYTFRDEFDFYED